MFTGPSHCSEYWSISDYSQTNPFYAGEEKIPVVVSCDQLHKVLSLLCPCPCFGFVKPLATLKRFKLVCVYIEPVYIHLILFGLEKIQSEFKCVHSCFVIVVVFFN